MEAGRIFDFVFVLFISFLAVMRTGDCSQLENIGGSEGPRRANQQLVAPSPSLPPLPPNTSHFLDLRYCFPRFNKKVYVVVLNFCAQTSRSHCRILEFYPSSSSFIFWDDFNLFVSGLDLKTIFGGFFETDMFTRADTLLCSFQILPTHFRFKFLD